MNKKWMTLLGVFGMLATAFAGIGITEQKIAVEEAIRRANTYFQANSALGSANWTRGTYHTGNMRAWETLGVQAYYDYSVAWAEDNSWLRGPPTDISHADSHCCGQTYIDLYNVDPQAIRTNDIFATIDYVIDSTDYTNDWSWIDAFYMAASVFARMTELTDDSKYTSAMYDMYLDMKNVRGLFDPSTGLWWRDGNKKNNNPDVYWGRGNGWVIGSLARILEQLPPDDTTYRPEFESMLQIMASSLLQWQQPDGFWRASITDPTNPDYDNPETSSTAFFTYAIAYGLNEGILVDSPGTNYTAAVSNAWYGMIDLALRDNGKVGYVQPVGSYPVQPVYDYDKDYGYGAFLLAGCEILRMLGGPTPVYPDAGSFQSLDDTDGDYIESVVLTASNTVVRSGSVDNYSWWCGLVYLGSGVELPVDVPIGTNSFTLQVEHSDGNAYSNHVSVVVSPPNSSINVSASDYQSPNLPENTLDGSLNTRWSLSAGDGSAWIQYTLPETNEINHIDIAFYRGNQRQTRLAIWLSEDGTEESLTRVLPAAGDVADYVSASGTTTELETFSFPAQTVKLLRIQGWGNSANGWNSYTEVDIPGTFPPPPNDQTDSDGNGLPDSWEIHYFGSNSQDPSTVIDETGLTLSEAYVLGLDPVSPDASPWFQINTVSNQPNLTVQAIGAFGVGYHGLARKYTILTKPTLTNEVWTSLPGYTDVIGAGLPFEAGITNSALSTFYTIQTALEGM